MVESEFNTGQQQALATELFGEEAVVTAFPVRGITDDRVGNVLQVTADLMAPAGNRLDLQQRVTAAWIAIDGKR